MRRIGPLLMSTMLVTGCAGLATTNESLRSVLERGGQSQPKLTAYEQGKRYLQFGSAGLAVDAFQTALKDEPDSVPILNGLAVAYDRLGRADVSQRFLDRALSVDPNSAVTLSDPSARQPAVRDAAWQRSPLERRLQPGKRASPDSPGCR